MKITKMAKSKDPVPSIFTISKFLKKETLLPIYFFYGEDSYSIENARRAVETVMDSILVSDFDKEILHAKDRTVTEIIDLASSFPFSSEKKLIILNDFEEIKGDKKSFGNYAKNPVPHTVLVVIKHGSISNVEAEPYFSLLKNNYLFEANELKGNELISWIEKYSARKNKRITSENAAMLISIVGENRSLIEMQLQKIFAYLGEESEITHEIIQNQSSALKEFTIFELQNAIGSRNKARALEVGYNLLDKGKDILFILAMLTRYFTAIAQVPEIEKRAPGDQEAAKLIGVHPYFYKDYKKAAVYFRDERLVKTAKALFEADLRVKTTSTEQKTILTMLLAEILC